MSTRRWDDVRAELFAGREEEVQAAKEQLRAEIRAYRLAEIRKALHLTQQQVADEMGVTTARVSQIEHGQVDRAAIRGLAGYVEALGGQLELVANFGDERIVIGLQRVLEHLVTVLLRGGIAVQGSAVAFRGAVVHAGPAC
jgi:transcriptional regulator with XRE-family HTH domain